MDVPRQPRLYALAGVTNPRVDRVQERLISRIRPQRDPRLERDSKRESLQSSFDRSTKVWIHYIVERAAFTPRQLRWCSARESGSQAVPSGANVPGGSLTRRERAAYEPAEMPKNTLGVGDATRAPISA